MQNFDLLAGVDHLLIQKVVIPQKNGHMENIVLIESLEGTELDVLVRKSGAQAAERVVVVVELQKKG